METDKTLLNAFLLGGYRSFGTPQRFARLAKITLLIGPNNSGKSNVLRFLHDVYSKAVKGEALQFEPLDRHFPNQTGFRFGQSISLQKDKDGNYSEFDSATLPFFRDKSKHPSYAGQILRICQRKAELDGTDDVWFEFGSGKGLVTEGWQEAFRVLDDRELSHLWSSLTGASKGSREAHWYPETLEKITPGFRTASFAMIPAIRRVGGKGSESQGFSGEGMIERLARVQNPDAQKQGEKEKFARINSFLQSVTDNQSASIEIPYDRDTVLVHMDGKTLPLESLGTGIHEVVILAAAATILENTVVCMEEPELHLNPILQKKLVRYLISSTHNQYFITTHSAALMDTPEAETYHVQLQKGESVLTRVTSNRQKSAVCEDLGYHPSDLLMANCIIWVEGPSDRIYLTYWISKRVPGLVEGIHYVVMFYGGRLAAHVSGNDIDEEIEKFISLRRLNRRAVVVIDSDRSDEDSLLNATKLRLVKEFDLGPGHAWVTDGREIENYIDGNAIREAIAAVAPNAISTSAFKKFDRMLSIKTNDGKVSQAPKVQVARHIVEKSEFDDNRLELRARLDTLVAFIRSSNPAYEKVTA